MVERRQFIEFLGCSGTTELRRVTCFGVDGSLVHPPIGTSAYNLVYSNVYVALNGEELVADECVIREGPFVLPSSSESYLRFMLGDEDYTRSRLNPHR